MIKGSKNKPIQSRSHPSDTTKRIHPIPWPNAQEQPGLRKDQ